MSELSNRKFTELHVWKKARELKLEIFELVKSFPTEEKYRLTDQLIRASRSVLANIAEGHGRFTYNDQIHFCIQSRGSLSEILNHLIDAKDCNYITNEKFVELEKTIIETEKLLNGYITYLRKQII
jgi:four helix bundle protein